MPIEKGFTLYRRLSYLLIKEFKEIINIYIYILIIHDRNKQRKRNATDNQTTRYFKYCSSINMSRSWYSNSSLPARCSSSSF